MLSLLSAEVEREQRRQCNRGKAQQDAATSVVELSGSEEGSSGDDFSDLSMTDSDLHRASLLQEFLYSEEPARETALASKPHINIAKVKGFLSISKLLTGRLKFVFYEAFTLLSFL